MSAPEVVAVAAGAWVLLKWMFLKDRSAKGHRMFLLVKTVPFLLYVGVLEIFLVSVPFGSLLFWLFMIPVWFCARKVKKLARREIARQLYRRRKLDVPEGAEVVPERKLVVMTYEIGPVAGFQVFEPGDLFPSSVPFPDAIEVRFKTMSCGEELFVVKKTLRQRGRFKVTNHDGTSKVQVVQPET